MNVKLVGISKRGKDKIKAHGDSWDLVIDGQFKGQTAWMLMSKLTENLRWVFVNSDPDFKIIQL